MVQHRLLAFLQKIDIQLGDCSRAQHSIMRKLNINL